MSPGPPGGERRLRSVRREAVAVGAALLAVYGATAATTIQGGDASEFLVVGLLGGVAHPPGYPLHAALIGWAGRLLPGPLPWRGAMVAAACGAAAFALLHHAGRRLGASRGAALAATAGVALGTLPWRHATAPEVFAGAMLSGSLVVAAVVGAVLRPGRPATAWWVGAAFATGLAHHHSTALLAPLGLVGLLAALPARTPAALAGSAARFLTALGVGLVAYLPLMEAEGPWRWGATGDLRGLLHHLLRRDYGTFSLAAAGIEGAAPAQVGFWARSLVGDLLLLLPALPAGWLALRRRKPGLAWGWLAALLLAGPAFAARFGLPAEGFWLVVVRRFHLLPLALCTPLVALGVDAFLRAAARRRGIAAPLVGAAALLPAALALHRGAPHRGWTVLEDHLRHVLADAPPEAVIVGTGDSRLFGMLYLQEVEGLRPDVTWLDPDLARMGWYRAWLRRRDPRLRWPSGDPAPWPAALARAQLGIRPVLIVDRLLRQPGVPRSLPAFWPTATGLFRVGEPGERPPAPAELERRMAASLARAAFRSRVRTPWQATRTWEYEAWDQPALAWLRLARAYRRLGDGAGARRAVEQAWARSPLRPEVRAEAEALGLAPPP